MAYFHIDRTRFYIDSLGLSQPLRAKPQKVVRERDPRRQLVLLVADPRAGARHRRRRRRRGRRRDRPRVRPLAPGPGSRTASLQTRQGADDGRGLRRLPGGGDVGADHRRRASSTPASSTGTGSPTRPTGTCGRTADSRPRTSKKAEKQCGKEIHCVGEVWRVDAARAPRRRSATTPAASRSWTGSCSSRTSCSPASRTSRPAAQALLAADQLLYAGAHDRRSRPR